MYKSNSIIDNILDESDLSRDDDSLSMVNENEEVTYTEKVNADFYKN